MSSVLRWKAEKEVAITTALARLGAARRERLTADDLKVYADGLRAYPIEAIAAVCEDFARKPVEEFGSRFPTLGSLVEGVRDYLKREQIRHTLAMPRLTHEIKPVDPQKLAEFRDRVQALINSKTMQPVAAEREPGSDDE